MTVEVTYIRGWNEWLFGLTFLQNYYAVYDMEEQMIGFAISKTSTLASDMAILPVEQLNTFDSTMLLGEFNTKATSEWSVGSCAAAAFIPTAAMILLYKMIRSKKTKTNDDPNDTDEKFRRIC